MGGSHQAVPCWRDTGLPQCRGRGDHLGAQGGGGQVCGETEGGGRVCADGQDRGHCLPLQSNAGCGATVQEEAGKCECWCACACFLVIYVSMGNLWLPIVRESASSFQQMKGDNLAFSS